MSSPCLPIRTIEIYVERDSSWGLVPIIYEELNMPNPRGITEHLSPTHRRMMNILLDREWHSRDEMQECLSDETASVDNLYPHISQLRKTLRERGLGEIVSKRVGRDVKYRYIDP